MADLTQYSDAELEAMLTPEPTQGLEQYSDEELMAMAGEQPQAPTQPPAPTNIGADIVTAGLSIPKGLSFGWSDELGRMVQTPILAGKYAMAGQDDPWGRGAEHAERLRQARLAELERYQEANPIAGFTGEVAGALITPAGLAGGATKLAPKLTQKALQYGTKLPATTTAGIGAVSGGIYGAGVGDGTASEKIQEGAEMGLYGAGGGLAGYHIGQRVVKPLADRAFKLLQKKRGAVAPVMDEVTDVVTDELPIAPKAQNLQDVVEGDATDLIKGAKTQDIELMRSEALARTGVLGKELEEQVRSADKAFFQSVKNTTQALAGDATEETGQDTLTKAIGLVKNRYDAEKRLQGALMTKRNNAIAKTKIYSDYAKDTLGKSLDDLKQTPDFKVALQRSDNAPLKENLVIMDKLLKGKNTKSINMPYLASWRSGLNDAPAGSQLGVLNKRVAGMYDDWLEGLTKTAFKEGDEETIDAIFKANRSYREFKTKYGTNKYAGQKKVIENLIQQEEMTPRAMVNTVFGKSPDGKDYTEQYVKRMLDTMPEGAQRERVREGFRAGLIQKSFENSYDELSDTINLGKLRTSLVKMKKSDSFKNHITTKEHDTVLDSLITDLGKYQRAVGDKDITNLSGTTGMALRVMQSIGGIPVIKNMPLTRGSIEVVGDISRKGARATNKRDVEKSLAEFYKAISPEIDKNIKYNFGGAVAGGAGTATILEEDK